MRAARTPRPRRRPARPPPLTWPDATWRWTEDGALALTLPVPGSANRQWRAGKGRTHKSAHARQYEESAGWALASCPKLRGPVQVTLCWIRQRATGDLDNRIKPTLDALKQIAFEDDAQVRRITAEILDAPDLAACLLVTIAPDAG